MVRILIHQKTPNINYFFILREVVGRVIAACYSFLLSTQFILSRGEAWACAVRESKIEWVIFIR